MSIFSIGIETARNQRRSAVAGRAASILGGFAVAVVASLGASVATSDAASAEDSFSIFTTGVLGDFVWLDLDFDGVFDPAEIGLSGIDVTVSWNSGSSSTTVTTGFGGSWTVGSLPFNIPLTVTVDDTDLPGNLTVSHDFDDSLLTGPIATPYSAVVTLTAGAPTNNDLDFGYLGLGQVGDTLWLDIDGNGASVPAPGDVLLSGIDVVTAWTDPGPGGQTVELTSTSDGSGFWRAQGLPAGNVTVTPAPATLPTGITSVYDADGGSDGTVTVDLTDDLGTAGVDESIRFDIDFAWTGSGSIGDLVWLDSDGDQTSAGESGIGSTSVDLGWTDPVSGTTNTWSTDTSSTGAYVVANLPAGFYQVTVPDVSAAGLVPTFDGDGVHDGVANIILGAGADMTNIDFGFRNSADIRVVATVSGQFRFGEDNEFAVQVDNLGPGSAIAPIQVVHTLPGGLTFVGVVGGGAAAWSCAADPAPNQDTVRCDYLVGDLGNGAGSSYDLSVNAGAAAAPSATLASAVASFSLDNSLSNNDHTVDADVPLADLSLTINRLDPLNAGSIVTYELALRNNGPSPTSGAITLIDDLPAGLAYDDFSGAGWTCAPASGDVLCIHLGVIPVGATALLQLELLVTASAGQSVANTVSATGGNEVGGTSLDQGDVDAAFGAAADGLTETVSGSGGTTTTTTSGSGAGTTTTAPGGGGATTSIPGGSATTTTAPGGGSGNGGGTTTTTSADGSVSGGGSQGGGQTDTDGDGLPDELAQTGLGEVILWFVVIALLAGVIMTWATRPLRRPRAGEQWGV